MRQSKRYRGSPRRVRRLDWREHTPRSLWIVAAVTLCAALLVLSWLHTRATP
jgi:hypothetical protein